jgi:hypothetical protein
MRKVPGEERLPLGYRASLAYADMQRARRIALARECAAKLIGDMGATAERIDRFAETLIAQADAELTASEEDLDARVAAAVTDASEAPAARSDKG